MLATINARPACARRERLAALSLALAVSAVTPSLALGTSTDAEIQQTADGGQDSTSIWKRDHLLDDPLGLRSLLESHGISINLQETSEVLGNPAGGFRTGAVYEGATLVQLKVDTEKMFGLPGGTFNASAWQIHGSGLTQNNIGNLNTVSSIEATRGIRLFELWYEQALFGGAFSVRVGQMAADQEFQISTNASLFVNSSFGWPTLAAVDQPGGGPAYPLASLGGRLKAQPWDDFGVLIGIFSGSPAPAGAGNPQVLNSSGTAFVLNQGVFVISEVQYTLNGSRDDPGLPGNYKLGMWYNSEQFPDQRYANDGLLLADPASTGVPLGIRNNWSWYAVADQLVWRPEGAKDRGIGVFARMTGTSGDRNLVNFFVNAGVTWKGAIPMRPDDTTGLGIGFTRISDRARRFDGDVAFFSGSFFPIRTSETVLELTYQAPVTPWLTMQPDFQYIFNPAGGVPNPNHPAIPIGNVAVFALRGVVMF